jgi:hypothetical protein
VGSEMCIRDSRAAYFIYVENGYKCKRTQN